MVRADPLYELAAEYRSALDSMEASGFDPETIADSLESIAEPLEEKILAVAKYILHCEAMAGSIGEAEARMRERRKSYESKAQSLTSYLLAQMTVTRIAKVERPELSVSIHKKAPRVEIYEDLMIPASFRHAPAPPPPDKLSIAAALKRGEVVPGARLISGEVRVAIK